MAASIEKAKADDPKELRKEIANLRTQLTKAQKSPATASAKPVVDEKAIERAVSRALDAQAAAISKANWETVKVGRKAVDQLERAATSISEAVPGLRSMLARLETPVPIAPNGNGNGHTRAGVAAPTLAGTGSQPGGVSVRTVTPRASSRDPKSTSESPIGRTPQRMLNALLFFERIGVSQPTRAQLGGFVGVSPSTGTFRNYLSELRSFAFINDLGTERVELTHAGRSQASEEGLPRSLEELHRTWRAKFGATPARMFDVLLDAYPNTVTRDNLAAAVGVDPSTGTFRNYLSELRSPGALEDVSKSEVRVADMLFPEGLG
jgi:hypothetical protein